MVTLFGMLVNHPDQHRAIRDQFYQFTNQFEPVSIKTPFLLPGEKMILIANKLNGSKQVIGYCVFTVEESRGVIDLREVYVAEKYRGNGVFGQLVKMLERHGEEVAPGELEQMCVGVHNLNYAAKQAYWKAGFNCCCSHHQCATKPCQVTDQNRYCSMGRPIRQTEQRE